MVEHASTRLWPAVFAIGCLVALCATPEAKAADQGTREYCFPQQALSIGGVHYRDWRAAVDQALGQPFRIRKWAVPGTAGAYRVERRQYRDLWLDLKVSTQEVETVVATGPRVAMPNGVRVGAALADVSKRMRHSIGPALSADLVWTPSLCEQGPYDWIFVAPQFTFTKDKGEIRLRSIRIQRI